AVWWWKRSSSNSQPVPDSPGTAQKAGITGGARSTVSPNPPASAGSNRDERYQQTMLDLRSLLIRRAREGDTGDINERIRRNRAEILALAAPPLTRLDAVLKCHRQDDLGPLSMATLERAFPIFNGDRLADQIALFRRHGLPFDDFAVFQ